MKILVLNCGSSSLKYQLIDMEKEEVLTKGTYERIGQENSVLTHKKKEEKYTFEHKVLNHDKAIAFVLEKIIDPECGAIKKIEEIDAVGHRVVHGGEKISQSVVIDDEVIQVIKDCTKLAPLHNPAAILGIEACQKVVPNIPMVAVFDTAFHQTMPEESYIYPIDYAYYEKYGIRKYGFHGTSHKFVSAHTAELMNKPLETLKIVVCHLGQGASICAVKNGKSVDTSMGLTPLGGIPMGTRCGDLDPSVSSYLMEQENLSLEELNMVLNKKSGVFGISGISQDFRDIEAAKKEGNKRAKLALDNYTYLVAQYIARYAVALGGIDAIAFTAGVGENQIGIRKAICERLAFMGIEMDDERNNTRGEDKLISSDRSSVQVFVVPTNEELMIARDTQELVSK